MGGVAAARGVQPACARDEAGRRDRFVSLLYGSLYRPAGRGPFPAVVYNHGSACSMIVADAAAALGPVFTPR